MPKSIVKEQKLIFLYIYYSMIFEGISDFIHATDFFSLPHSEWSMWCNLWFSAYRNQKGRGNEWVTVTLNNFSNYFFIYNSVNCFPGLIMRAGRVSVVMQSCLNAVLIKHCRYQCELLKCSHFSGLETHLLQYWLTLHHMGSLCPWNNFCKFKCNFQLMYSLLSFILTTLQNT